MAGSKIIKYTGIYMMIVGTFSAISFLAFLAGIFNKDEFFSNFSEPVVLLVKFCFIFDLICRAALPVLGFFAFISFDNEALMTKLTKMAVLLLIANIVAIVLCMISLNELAVKIFRKSDIYLNWNLIYNSASIGVLLFGIREFLADEE